MQAAPEPSSPSPRARFALVVSLWGLAVSYVTLTVLIIALPTIARDLAAPMASTNWVTIAPMLSVAAFTPLAGGLADRIGAKPVWLGGLALTLLGILGSALAPDLPTLIVSRFVSGVGSALFTPAALAITSALYPPHARATPIGYWTSTVAIAPLVGVIVGGYVTELWGWRTLFYAQLALGIPALLAGLSLPHQRAQHGRTFDLAGSLMAALAAAGLLCVFSSVGDLRLTVPLTVLATGALAVIERRAVAPIFPPALLARPMVRQALLSRFALGFTYMGSCMIVPYLLGSLWGQSPSAVALTLAVRPLAMGLVGAWAGRLARRYGNAGPTIVGAWLVFLSCIAFALLGVERTLQDQLWLGFGLIAAGIGIGIGSPGPMAAV
ncbi:MAG TPA: MFS transporter, partial [Polyangiales bacterium]